MKINMMVLTKVTRHLNAAKSKLYRYVIACGLLICLGATGSKAQDTEGHCRHAQSMIAFHSAQNDPLQRSNSSNNFDVHFYRCTWEINPTVRFIQGSVGIHFKMLQTGNQVIVDLRNGMTIDSVKYHNTVIANAIRPGNHSAEINFPSNINAGALDSVTLFYKGAPDVGTPFPYFGLNTHAGTAGMWTESQPYGARYWWPCKDNLLDKADSIEIIAICPDTYRSASNGVIAAESTAGGKRTIVWKHRYRIAAYLVAIAVTNYTVLTNSITLGAVNMPVITNVYPESQTTFQNSIPNLTNALGQFHTAFGPYPFINEHYAQTQAPTGLEHQTNSFVSNAGSGLMAHELGHQWFGDKVTCGNWAHLWLNEGFATFCEAYYIELNNPTGLKAYLQNVINNITASNSGSVFVTDTNNLGTLFNSRLVYNKGSYLCRMLRWKLGDALFFQGLKNYLNDPLLAYGSAVTNDLKRNLENVSGQNLTEFFNDWFMGQGHPSYSIRWNQIATNTAAVEISQTSSHPSVSFFEMPVPIRFVGSGGRDTTVVFDHINNAQLYNFQLSFPVISAEFDPNLWLLSKNNSINRDASLLVTSVTDPVFDNEIVIRPNPSAGELTVISKSATRRIRSIVLQDISGRTLQNLSYGTTGTTRALVDMNRLAAGTYVLSIRSQDNRLVVRKLVR
jgi:aminopeptidase N